MSAAKEAVWNLQNLILNKNDKMEVNERVQKLIGYLTFHGLLNAL